MEITLNNLVRTYHNSNAQSADVHAVSGISLHIPSNDIFGIIGRSGAGKSTLVRLISLLEKPDSGEVLYDGERVDNLSAKELIMRRRRFGMIFQNFNLFASRTAGQNIAYPLEICGTSKDKIASRVKELLELVDLADRADAPISTLSGGQKQRIAIARALANNPDILFCDEATSALDPQTTHSILNLIRKIQSQMNLTVVMITHQMEVVRDACSLVAVLNEGKVVEQGSVNDIFMRPKSPVTKSFLAGLTQNDGAASGQVSAKGGASAGDSTKESEFVRWSSEGGKYVLRFVGGKTGEPVLSEMAKRFSVEFNIRAAGVQTVKDTQVGTLVLDIYGEQNEVERALGFLKEQGVTVEAK